jgi:hypothetical protein
MESVDSLEKDPGNAGLEKIHARRPTRNAAEEPSWKMLEKQPRKTRQSQIIIVAVGSENVSGTGLIQGREWLIATPLAMVH